MALILFIRIFSPTGEASAAPDTSYRYGDTIRGNVISAADKESGNDRWSADRSVTLGEGTLWWIQNHNPLQGGTVRTSSEPRGSLAFTSFDHSVGMAETSDESEYVYYRTVGMRFTLEDISLGEENVPTLDMATNSAVWEKPSVRFVDVFLSGVGESVKTRTSALLASGPSAGGRRRVSSAVMVTRDITNGSGVIEGHYYIDNFLTRDTSGRIKGDSVAGQLINLECGSDTLPTGEWRIYASHIIEIMTATRDKQPNGQYILKNRRERLVDDGSGNQVPDIRTTLVDVLSAANWAGITRDEYLPALFNRFLELTDEKLLSTTTVINYYLSGSDPHTGIVKTVYPDTGENPQGGFSTVALEYEAGEGVRPENLRLDLDEAAFADVSGKSCNAFDGIVIFSGDSPYTYGCYGTESPGYTTSFRLSGSAGRPFITPLKILDGMGENLSVTAPYVCIWVPLKSAVQVTYMYVTGDNAKPVLVRDGGTFGLSGGSGLNVPLSEMCGSKAQADLSNPLLTADGAEYELSDESPDTGIRHFYGTDRWNLVTDSPASKKNSIKDPARTVSSLTVTGDTTDGRMYGVMGEGFSNIVAFGMSRYVTDVVFFIKVVRKKPAITTRKLFIRYVPAEGQTHILKDTGPIGMPLGQEYTYIHKAPESIEYEGKIYEPAADPLNVPRPLLGVWTDDADRLPRSYSVVTGPGNGSVYFTAQTEVRQDGSFGIVIPPEARDAMLFVPYVEKQVPKKGPDVNIYYINGSAGSGYRVLYSEKRSLPPDYFSRATDSGNPVWEFAIRKEITEEGTGALWRPIENPDFGERVYTVISSPEFGQKLGNLRYPQYDEPGWTRPGFIRESNDSSIKIGVAVSENVGTYEIFVPCGMKTGDNPVLIYAVDAFNGRLLVEEPITTGFMSGNEMMIDVSGSEQISSRGREYAMIGGAGEEDEYPYKITAYVFASLVTQVVPAAGMISRYIVSPTVYLFNSISGIGSCESGYRSRNVYIDISGLSVPAGNKIAVYVPYRTCTEVNVFLITEDCSGEDPLESAAEHMTYHVSRSHWVSENVTLKHKDDETEESGGGWFEFDVPGEVCDLHGVSHSLSEEDPVAVHYDSCCDGVMQRVGLCSVSCPRCDGTGMMTVHGRAGAQGAKEKCDHCDGSGVWITAMNYLRVDSITDLKENDIEVRTKCTACNGSGCDPALATHAHESKPCPECGRGGLGPTEKCTVCYGWGQVKRSFWKPFSYINENGQLVSGSEEIFESVTCPACGGDGLYRCGTCDGTGVVPGDLCTHCCVTKSYKTYRDGRETNVMISSYGTGYNTRYRRICSLCGGRGYTACAACNGTGWSSTRDTDGRVLPCLACGGSIFWEEDRWEVMGSSLCITEPAHWEYVKGEGETKCICTELQYSTDPDPGYTDERYHRGQTTYTYYEGEYHESRDNMSFMTGGFYCDKCNAYLLFAGFPYKGTIMVRKDRSGKAHLTVYSAADIHPSFLAGLYDTDYREVEIISGSYGEMCNHAECALPLMTECASYDEAKGDTAHRTIVERAKTDAVYTGTHESLPGSTAAGAQASAGTVGTEDQVRMRVYVPSDLGTKSTDVYVLYTEWQPFTMPEPEPLISPPDPYVAQEDVVFTDLDTDSCEISIVAGYNGGEIYDPALSIPSGRKLKLKATGKGYLYDIRLVNVTGMVEIPVTVRYPYAFYESAAAYRRGEMPKESGFIEKTVTVKRPYSYWSIEKMAVWGIKEAGALCNVFTVDDSGYVRITASPGTGVIPQFSCIRRGEPEDHIVGVPPGGETIIEADALYADIFKNGVRPLMPVLDEGYALRIAYEQAPDITALDDTLVFDGQTVLGTSESLGAIVTGPGKTVGPLVEALPAGRTVTFMSQDKMIPTAKKNGTYPVTAAIMSYSLASGSVGFADETKYRSTGKIPAVVVQTPVYVKGTLFMTPEDRNGEYGQITDNLMYVQQRDADTGGIWAVAGEERLYEGFTGYAPAQTFCTCDLFAKLTNTADASHPHLSYPGYGLRTYDKDIYTREGRELPYNMISFDIRVVIDRSVKGGQISWEPDLIENHADVILEAGEWMSVPADTTIRFIVPRDTREGRHYITFASVATNNEDPDDIPATAMEIANTYYLSHAVYDRKFFNVAHRLWGLTLESVSGPGGYTSVYDTNSAQNVLTTGENNKENQNNGILNVHRTGVGNKSAAGLPLADPPGSFFPATEKEGIRAGVTAHFSIISDGVRANREIIKVIQKNQNTSQSGKSSGGSFTEATEGLYLSPKIYFVPCDSDTGDLLRDEAVEADLWYDSGPFTGKPGLALFEPDIRLESLLSCGNQGVSEILLDDHNFSTGVEEEPEEIIIGFSLFIPAGLKVSVKGALENTPRSVGFTANDSVWLKNGVIVIAFDPKVTYRIADRIVTVGYDCGPADMWKLEGYRESDNFRKGDILAFDCSSDIRDAFFVDHLN